LTDFTGPRTRGMERVSAWPLPTRLCKQPGVSGGSTMLSSEVLAWRSGGTDLRAFEILVTGPNRPEQPQSTPENQSALG
jgi:hypothetical protein